MREIDVSELENAVAALCQEANFILSKDVIESYRQGLAREESPIGREIFEMLMENARIAGKERLPLCQDTGLAVIFLDIGQDVRFVGGDLRQAVDRGVAKGYAQGYLRKSVTADPLRRRNTGDNTPAMLHVEIVPGEKVRVVAAPKGAGSENMSALRMLRPADGLEGVKKFVLETVRGGGANPCPPIVVGVGIGGTFEIAAYKAKKSLLRPLGQRHADPYYAELEIGLLEEINGEGIGPMGLGGRVTALDVHVETYPCHIASLPVAVNISCHSIRHRERII